MPNSTLSFTSSSDFRNKLMGKNLPKYIVPGSYTPPNGPTVYEVPINEYSVIDSQDKISFIPSQEYRNKLNGKNLPPYNVPGAYTPPGGPINYPTILSNYSIKDSISFDDVVYHKYLNSLYPLNGFGPTGGYTFGITYNGVPNTLTPNQGEYGATDAKLPNIGSQYLTQYQTINSFNPYDGYTYLYSVDVKITNPLYHVPYHDQFVVGTYSPYQIFFSPTPTGVSTDSYLAKIGAQTLHNTFKNRIGVEIEKNTIGKLSLVSLQDPFDISLILSGKQPLIARNWRITVPENPIAALGDFATRISGAYWPVSFIPGDYFDENTNNGVQTSQTSKALDVANNLTGGFLGPILNKTRNPSQLFLGNTGNGQKSALFNNINYNRYQPAYNKGIIQSVIETVANAINPNNGTLSGGYYVGNSNTEPSTLTSPANEIPTNSYGQQVPMDMYGPSEMGKLFEGNIDKIKFGFGANPMGQGGGIDGEFSWTSTKGKDGSGYKAKPGGDKGSLDGDFNQIQSVINKNQSTNIEFKQNSILDNTQRIVESADNVAGEKKLRHVGTAINQVSKVFNDGYRELTKGSRVVSYQDNTNGTEAGIEYCRVFTKDTPYYTYNDLQKGDGITTSGRRFTNSVLDNTYNLNIAPLKNPGSTNITQNKNGDFYAKKYMFSIENLAWRTSSRPGYTYDELPVCEKGPNGGRVMWFPPYNLKFSDSSNADFNGTSFIGRPEPIYTYKNTSRSGTLSWTIIVDSPSVMNRIVDEQLKGIDDKKKDSILNSFFAGCTKFDIYELAKKYTNFSVNELYDIQEILNNPRLTSQERVGVIQNIPKDNTGQSSSDNGTNKQTGTPATPVDFSMFNKKYFYFENDYPDPKTLSKTSSTSFENLISSYISDGNQTKYVNQASSVSFVDGGNKNVKSFFENTIIPSYDSLIKGEVNLVSQLFKAMEQNNTVTITLTGSASAVAKNNYNVNLSTRRIDSVKKFLNNYQVGGKTLKEYIDNKKITIVEKAEGEDITITSGDNTSDTTNFNEVSCTKDIEIYYQGKKYSRKTSPNNAVRSLLNIADVYSVDAMACRRVRLDVEAKAPTVQQVQEPEPIEQLTTTINPKPQPTIDVQKKIKDGISKKIIRKMLSECDYFEMIKSTDPMIYNSISQKIKYFNPAFHSMTPEGLNARVTFLNQCLRPGETIPTVDEKGNIIKKDAINTSFGAPPILVLRIGDYFHTKIVPDSVSFSYDPMNYDLNPEGIGVQPMFVNVQMNFKIIGGMGLQGPIDELQNALSFNYYANTEMYDERATPTEDTSKLDKMMVDNILAQSNNATPVNTSQVVNNGGNTIGEIKTTIPVDGGEQGQISYQTIMDKQLDNVKGYITTISDQFEKMNKIYNYGFLQLVSYKTRDYVEGYIGVIQSEIYGKPNQLTNNLIDKLFDYVIRDCDITGESINNPILDYFNKKGFSKPSSDHTIDMVQQNLISYIKNIKSSFSNEYTNIIQTIVLEEQNLIQNINKLNFIKDGFDGKIVDGLTPKVYFTSGTTDVSPLSNVPPIPLNTSEELLGDINKIGTTLKDFSEVLKTEKIVNSNALNFDEPSATFKPITDNIGDYETGTGKASIRFYMVLSSVFLDKSKLEEFKKSILKGPLSTVKNAKKIEKTLNEICDDLVKNYKKEYDAEQKIFTTYKQSKTYNDYTVGIESKLYPKGKTRILDFTTVTTNETIKTTAEGMIKILYSTTPITEPKNTFNDKTKLN